MAYFGTDGIRGPANGAVLNPAVVVRIGQAVGQVLKNKLNHAKPTVVIGKDTRLSGYMLESALQAGFTSVGFTCLLVGPLPTPAVSMLTRSLRADVGVMITASHNPYDDNGLKFFGPDGIKLAPEVVAQIEALIDAGAIHHASAEHVGRAYRVDDAVGRYVEYIKTSVPKDLRLDGLKVVLDAAHGAAYKIAPRTLWELGAEVVSIGTAPNGLNINAGVGATAPAALQAKVLEVGAHLGLALDGDADRLQMVDETGALIDGDHILASMAKYLHETGGLKGGAVVGTLMTNLGLEEFLTTELNVKLVRTPVGDHYVEAALREGGANLGGEPNGHLIFKDFAHSGDGLLAALQVLALLRTRGLAASRLRGLFKPWPQLLENVRLAPGTDAAALLASPPVQAAIQLQEANLRGQGRILVRKSGTEPLIRVMAEAREAEVAQAAVAAIVAAIKA